MPGQTVHRVLDPDPVETFADHLTVGGGLGLDAARRMSAEEVIAVLDAAGLRGRGGAGFPTAEKWRTVVASGGAHTVVVNAAEGEPGTFKDRTLLRRNPYRLLEGAIIAAGVVGAQRVVIGLKEKFTPERRAIETALRDVTKRGWCEGVDVEVLAGPDVYLFGEETALLEVIDGRAPFPRVAPPYREGVAAGTPADTQAEARVTADERPTLINNVETLCHVAQVVAYGPDWFRSLGTPESPGTVVCTITGDTVRAGVVEVPMGTPLGEVIEAAGGGPIDGREIAAVMVGVSHPVLTGDVATVPVSWEGMRAAGAGLGAAGFMVFDDSTDMLAVADATARFLAIESCGQCEPCKLDGLEIHEQLSAMRSEGEAHGALKVVSERLDTITRGARCALASQHQEVVGSILSAFPTSVEHRMDANDDEVEPVLIAPLVDIDDDGRAVVDDRHLDRQPDWHDDDRWSGAMPADDPEGTQEALR